MAFMLAVAVVELVDVILGKKVGRRRHRLKLQIVARGILEEHSPLFAGLTLFG